MEEVNNEYNVRLEKAQKKVKRLKDFYHNLMVYVIVISFLAILNWLTSPSYWWVLWVVFGWGIAILIQAISLFKNGLWGDKWEERQIKKIMEEE